MIKTDRHDIKMDSPRRIRNPSLLKFKIKKDGPYEFVLEDIEDKIIITGIFEGGIIYKHGGPKIGDELLDVNGVMLKGKTLSECVDILEEEIQDSNKNYVEFTIYRDPSSRIKEMITETRETYIGEELEEEVTSL